MNLISTVSPYFQSIRIALLALGFATTLRGDNPPPCEPCEVVEIPKLPENNRVQASMGTPQRAGLKGWTVKVTWTPNPCINGLYLPWCWNVNGGLDSAQEIPGVYVPAQQVRNYYVRTGERRPAMSDNFYLRYTDPCEGGPYKDAGQTYGLDWIEGPGGGNAGDDDDDDDDGDADGDGIPDGEDDDDDGDGVPDGEEGEDPYEDEEEEEDPECGEPFEPEECPGFENEDTREETELPEAESLELIAETISFSHRKSGFAQYIDPPEGEPAKYYLEEHAVTSLSGGNPESPVGGTVTRRVCKMTGDIIITEKTGNPSYYGPREDEDGEITETSYDGSFEVESYDDCPNHENDEPGELTVSADLTEEYTTDAMKEDAFRYAWDFKGDGYYEINDHPTAELLVDDLEEYVSYSKTRYKWRIREGTPQDLKPIKVTWVEIFVNEEGEKEVSRVLQATISSTQTGEYTIDPQDNPDKEGKYFVLPLSIEVLPFDEESFVEADVAEVDIAGRVYSDEDLVTGGTVAWSLSSGNGQLSASTQQWEEDEFDIETTLHTQRQLNGQYRVKAKIQDIKVRAPWESPDEATVVELPEEISAETSNLTVAPGLASQVQIQMSGLNAQLAGSSMPADGYTQAQITATIKDSEGNPVAEGATVLWRLEGDGTFVSYQDEVDANGKATAVVQAGTIPGMAQKVYVEIDGVLQQFDIANTALQMSLGNSGLASAPGDSSYKEVQVSVAANATNGAPVRWMTTRGVFKTRDSVVNAGVASAIVNIPWDEDNDRAADGGLAVITAAVGQSIAITSVELGGIGLDAGSGFLAMAANTSVQIRAPGLYGQDLQISLLGASERQTSEVVKADVALRNYELLPTTASLVRGQGDVVLDLIIKGGPVIDAFSGDLFSVAGLFEIEMDSTQRLVLKAADGRNEMLPRDLSALAPDTEVLLKVRISDSSVSLDCLGDSKSLLLSPETYDPWVPISSPKVDSQAFVHFVGGTALWHENSGVAGATLAGLQPGNVLPYSATNKSFGIVLAQGFVGSSLRVSVMPVGGGAPETFDIPVADETGGTGQLMAEMGEAHGSVEYDNRTNGDATAEEKAELSGWVADGVYLMDDEEAEAEIREPLALGGNFTQQVAQANKLLELTGKLNSVAHKIEIMAKEAETLQVTNSAGQQIVKEEAPGFFAIHCNRLRQQVIGTVTSGAVYVGTNVLPYVIQMHEGAMAGAETVARKGFEIVVSTGPGQWAYDKFVQVASDLGGIPLFGSLREMMDQYTVEGVVEFVKALHRFSTALKGNTQIASILVFTELDEFLGPLLNDWAANGGEPERVATGFAGFSVNGTQTAVMMGATVSDAASDQLKFAKRVVAQGLGMVLSAAFGDQQAQEELKKMVPIWSWVIIGEETKELWDAGDYYQSGKRANQIAWEVVGDVTIIVPIVKGVTVAVKSGTTLTARLGQLLEKSGTSFTRRVQGRYTMAKRSLGKLHHSIGCFDPSVLVVMGDGSTRAIGEIEVGDMVLSDNPHDEEGPAAREVTEVFAGVSERWFAVSIGTGSTASLSPEILATPEHPFWVAGRGWVFAQDLAHGDQLLATDGKQVTVEHVEERQRVSSTRNLNVHGSHTFFVATSPGSTALVHNTKPGMRCYIVYTVDLDDGTVYTGRASIATTKGTDIDVAIEQALKRRFSGHHRASQHPGFSRAKARVVWHDVYDPSEGYHTKRQVYGAMRGLEEKIEEHWASQEKSANRKLRRWARPISTTNPSRDYYLNQAEEPFAKYRCNDPF